MPTPEEIAAAEAQALQDAGELSEQDLDKLWKETVVDEDLFLAEPAPETVPAIVKPAAPAEASPPAEPAAPAAPAVPSEPPAPAEASPPAEPVAPAAPIVSVEPEAPPDPSPEEEREDILRAESELRRRQREFHEVHGHPVHDLRAMQEDQEAIDILKTFLDPNSEDNLQDIVKVMRYIARTENAPSHEQLVDDVRAGYTESVDQAHLSAVAAVEPDFHLIEANPGPLMEWIDKLPGGEYREVDRIIKTGDTSEVIGLIRNFKKALNINSYKDFLASSGNGDTPAAPIATPPAQTPTTPAQPEAAPQPTTDRERSEAATAVPGEGTVSPVAQSGTRPTAEQDEKRIWDSIPDKAL